MVRAGAVLAGSPWWPPPVGVTTATTRRRRPRPATSSGAPAPRRGPPATTAPAAQPTSMDEWEALWAKQRDAIVKRIKDNKWGKSADGKT